MHFYCELYYAAGGGRRAEGERRSEASGVTLCRKTLTKAVYFSPGLKYSDVLISSIVYSCLWSVTCIEVFCLRLVKASSTTTSIMMGLSYSSVSLRERVNVYKKKKPEKHKKPVKHTRTRVSLGKND